MKMILNVVRMQKDATTVREWSSLEETCNLRVRVRESEGLKVRVSQGAPRECPGLGPEHRGDCSGPGGGEAGMTRCGPRRTAGRVKKVLSY